MHRLTGAAVIGSVLAFGVVVVPAQAQSRAITAAELPRLVASAERGEAAAAARLDSWARAVRLGDPSALAVTADAMTQGIAADRGRIDEADRQAAAGGWDARTGYVRSVADGTARIAPDQAARFVARIGATSGVATGVAVVAPLDADLGGTVVTASFSSSDVDVDDVGFQEIEANATAPQRNWSTRTVCESVDYHDDLFGYTVMGFDVCIKWDYDHERWVNNASRTITPFVTAWGLAHGWRYVGAKLAEVRYFDYRRRGPKSGYHTRTIGHFQRCVVQFVVPMCDLDRLPQITLTGHYNGTFGSKVTP